MVAYLEGRDYFGGFFGFRLGRQYVIDPLGWWSFDGALARLSTPVFFAVEAYGGFEQRGRVACPAGYISFSPPMGFMEAIGTSLLSISIRSFSRNRSSRRPTDCQFTVRDSIFSRQVSAIAK